MISQKFGLTETKEGNFNAWYLDMLLQAELIDTYCIRGFIVMRPASFFIWKKIQNKMDSIIQERGVQEAYFPFIIPNEYLLKEKEHLQNFEPEVCWITKSGPKDIAPIAVRPTSETIIYPHFRNWIRSLRNLPVKINQWCNVLRWEVKSTLPFVRGREFLWQEGHCAYLTKKECDDDVSYFLEMYEFIYKNILAVPVVKGRKTESEKFGGADYTLSVEAFIKEAGRGIQAATSHSLGQNFSKMFDIKVEDVSAKGNSSIKKPHQNKSNKLQKEKKARKEKASHKKCDDLQRVLPQKDASMTHSGHENSGMHDSRNDMGNSEIELGIQNNANDINNQLEARLKLNDSPKSPSNKESEKNNTELETSYNEKTKESSNYTFVHQNSWGFTTRSIGIALMIHSDDIGAVLPPRVAQTQVVIVNCGKLTPEIQKYIEDIQQILKRADVRHTFDDRQNLNPGYKFNFHEIRGTPLRFEIGKKEALDRSICVFKRNTMKKIQISFENLEKAIIEIIDSMHNEMFEKAEKALKSSIKNADTFEEFKLHIGDKNLCLASWCGKESCEDEIKLQTAVLDENGEVSLTGAKSLCIPFQHISENPKDCVVCKTSGQNIVLFGRSY